MSGRGVSGTLSIAVTIMGKPLLKTVIYFLRLHSVMTALPLRLAQRLESQWDDVLLFQH